MYSETMKKYEMKMRQEMKEMLLQLPESQQNLFARSHDHKNQHKSPVDGIKFDKLDWAFMQIENSLKVHNKPKINFEYCPKCRGSFSFSKPVADKCPWCEVDLMAAYRKSCEGQL